MPAGDRIFDPRKVFFVTFRRIWLGLTAAALSTHAAFAEPPGAGSVPNAQLQKEVAVLQSDPDEASQACLDALKELHETQDKLSAEQERSHDQDIAVAQDVLESDFENAIEMCGPDARRMCSKHNPSNKLAHACEMLGSVPN
ncbi:hypothetical protein AA23498_2886 [Acetobacter nitrogenifigens DSM 23921 = NBRC 105050]|uniref:Lysozyme inhibitor LprI N-terminal domain-containing protein n=1 Tax=Acetobacter nitrogenifigens DSM 23921 = NBRC 105050 TaxID=1120919 RepID=A0A511XDK8_9PROT|nr:hypothetical protein AA23498_2886 [Acetobacter nitrogenifigens DSM 23921 = NBRC 105050]GEN61039.1 hypothetical protein ANI02nite_29230 [Acetobacter nitrogenifigens DSM 23921 = NBRC 105050]